MSELDELQYRLTSFIHTVQLVFDLDWEFTEDRIRNGGFVHGTFLNPQVKDEENNWANRARLLESYRALVASMKKLGIPSDLLVEMEEAIIRSSTPNLDVG